MNRKGNEMPEKALPRRNLFFLLFSVTITVALFVASLIIKDMEPIFSFVSGTLLLITLILAWRQFYTGRIQGDSFYLNSAELSRLYYSFYPSRAITPILFIAAGIFAVFITGANRMNFSEKLLTRSSGTGGYLLWCESTIPFRNDLNSFSSRRDLGLDSDSISGISFVEIKKSRGNDASCLNLNHIATPPLLGVDPVEFIKRESFSFSKDSHLKKTLNPWEYLSVPANNNTIYGIADQTVLEWGLKIKTGDTLILRAENGQPLNIVIAAALQSSVFQGYMLIGKENFIKYYPSVSGSSVLLIDGKADLTDLYKSTIEDRLANYGLDVEKTSDRLASFYEVTNTYLSVFGAFGMLGMITGVAGLGFVLLRNYNQRKREFALMMATGFTLKMIRRMILSEQILILTAGISTGVISAILATLPSIKANPDIPWLYLAVSVMAIVTIGLIALFLSVRSISGESLITSLKKD